MEIRRFTPSDKSSIYNLFEESFGKPINEEFWRWRYIDNPFKKRPLIDLMWDGDVLAGHYALWPLEMSYNGNVVEAAMSMTTMTKPSYSGLGIFTTLARKSYERAKDEHGIELIWGFPNKNSHYGFITKLNWKDIAIIPTLTVKMDLLTKKMNYDNFYMAEKFTLEDANSVQVNNPINVLHVNKSEDYLNWRYVMHPTNKYFILKSPEIHGFIVFKIYKKQDIATECADIDIVEWNVCGDSKQTDIAIRMIVTFTRETLQYKINKMNIWMSIHDHRHSLLEKNGFVMDTPLTYLSLLTTTPSNSFAINFNLWHLQKGDSDVY